MGNWNSLLGVARLLHGNRSVTGKEEQKIKKERNRMKILFPFMTFECDA